MVDYQRMSPQDRWLADKAAADASDPCRDFSRTLTRDVGGKLVQLSRAPSVERISEAEYAKLTYPEKVEYARRMSAR